MPVVHVYTAEGWLSPKRKKLMIAKITDAVVEAEGHPSVRDMTYVLIHDVPDGGWGFQGKVFVEEQFKDKVPPDPDL
jgi:phenylpyruvate tautomerase PptA (4-oxalocrotonate tautomerase family)